MQVININWLLKVEYLFCSPKNCIRVACNRPSVEKILAPCLPVTVVCTTGTSGRIPNWPFSKVHATMCTLSYCVQRCDPIFTEIEPIFKPTILYTFSRHHLLLISTSRRDMPRTIAQFPVRRDELHDHHGNTTDQGKRTICDS